ncbi:hypothetical protein TEA_003006 [Camellia sinensis var. sinensis]|uniref:Uncharacterized protein n=1 Tax=Camellia sinensis var. sinensis TaxID=542762 RepID=A0A4S4DQF4_CAMSN|nr:hypothetical protein TEA_003006 [Camellia sinensis var. sinensis]
MIEEKDIPHMSLHLKGCSKNALKSVNWFFETKSLPISQNKQRHPLAIVLLAIVLPSLTHCDALPLVLSLLDTGTLKIDQTTPSVIIPTLQWILPDQCPQTVSQEPCSFDGILELYSSLRLGLLQLVYVLWFYPLYIFSFIISSMWYNDIAKYGFLANAKSGNTVTELSSSPKATQTDKPTDLGGVMIGIAEQVYSVLLLNVFFLEVFVTGYIPYFGKVLNFLLLSWMYAYYCFEYKWNFSGLSLDKRLDFFESNWAFFAGFGKFSFSYELTAIWKSMYSGYFLFLSSCELWGHGYTLSTDKETTVGNQACLWKNIDLKNEKLRSSKEITKSGSRQLSVLIEQFVLTASGSDADKLITSQRRKWDGAGCESCLSSPWNLENKFKTRHSEK